MNQNYHLKYLNIGLPDDILRYKIYGDFDGAIRLIDKRLTSQNLPQAFRNCLIAQREIMRRLPENYPFTKVEAIGRVQSHIADFTEAEFDTLEADGKIDWIYVGGVPHYFDRFFETLIKTNAAFAVRAGQSNVLSDGGGGVTAEPLDRIAGIMREKGSFSNRIRVRTSVRIKDEAFQMGEFVRVHLPVPCACEQQSAIRIERIEPADGVVSPENAAQRTICWEAHMAENHTFMVEYSYTHTARYHDLSTIIPDRNQPDFDTDEQFPHIVFTPYIRELVRTLTDGLENPLDKAKAFYDFITQNVKYSFVRAYFTLENISETCARNLMGDCGMMALLFITLCRCAGIPARWQSGLYTRPDFCGAHDWAMFYVAPYGWLYADPSFGCGAEREGNEARRKFYFGNLDTFRMVANTRFQSDFTVEKQYWRADPYDNQVGEIETSQRGLRYFEYERSKEVVAYEEI
ncbi:MAG: transglutaminase-like domain-containing protein [Candidatus Fimivivens sp.]